jgi:hypothetical protein
MTQFKSLPIAGGPGFKSKPVLAMRGLMLVALLAFALGACRADEQTSDVGVNITGLDHLAEHLSVQDFWVNGTNGHQAGKGGRQVCCAKLPAKWRPGLTVKVAWGVTNWRDHVYSMHERIVTVDKYDELGTLYIHFLRDGSVRAVTSMYAAWGKGGYYPGPDYSTVPRKQPWTDYKSTRPEGMREFPLVEDAMKGQRR